jgi:hypothetical protein
MKYAYLSFVAALFFTPAAIAATVPQHTAYLLINYVEAASNPACDGSVFQGTPVRYDFGFNGNSFQNRAIIAVCDGSVAIELSGDIDPFLSMGVTLIDFEAPTTFNFTFATPILPISGLVDFTVEGAMDVTVGPATTVLASDAFFDYRLNDTLVDSLGSGPLLGASAFADQSGQYDCATLTLGVCDELQINFVVKAYGKGSIVSATSIFTVEEATSEVPLPAALPLLLAGLGGLGILRRRH